MRSRQKKHASSPYKRGHHVLDLTPADLDLSLGGDATQFWTAPSIMHGSLSSPSWKRDESSPVLRQPRKIRNAALREYYKEPVWDAFGVEEEKTFEEVEEEERKTKRLRTFPLQF